MSDLNPKTMHTVLDEVYPKSELFILGVRFDDEELSVEVTCCVPTGVFYTAKPIPYVTTENYVRCLSQASYLFAEHLLTEGLIETDLDVASFVKAAADYELYYRSISMVFHQRVPRGEEFVLRLCLKNAREISRFDKDFLLFTFTNEKTVISGEMSFVQMK